jgi:subtilisin family serine protease
VVVVVAAGNDGFDPSSTYDTHVNCPGLAASAITVGASRAHESVFAISSVGPTPSGRNKPDVVAPGVGIVTCRPPGTGLGQPLNADFTRVDGTSSATAHVTGVVALMLQKNPRLSSSQVKAILVRTAIDIGASTGEMGAGCVDEVAALRATPAAEGSAA